MSNLGLVYFKNYGDHKALGFIPIYGCTVESFSEKFVIRVNNRAKEEFRLKALSELDCEEWVKFIRAY